MASASDAFLVDEAEPSFLSNTGRAPHLFRELWAYWAHLPREAGALPHSRTVDPVMIPNLLPYLLLAGVQYDPLDFSFRVVGNHIEERMGATYTGTHLSDWVHTSKESGIWRNMTALVESRRPMLANYTYIGPIPRITITKNLYVPLQDADGRVSDVLIAFHFENDVPVTLEDTRWSA